MHESKGWGGEHLILVKWEKISTYNQQVFSTGKEKK